MTAGTGKPKSVRALRIAAWIAVQMIVVVLLLEAALRIARPPEKIIDTSIDLQAIIETDR